jgi:hypothetical protein
MTHSFVLLILLAILQEDPANPRKKSLSAAAVSSGQGGLGMGPIIVLLLVLVAGLYYNSVVNK